MKCAARLKLRMNISTKVMQNVKGSALLKVSARTEHGYVLGF